MKTRLLLLCLAIGMLLAMGASAATVDAIYNAATDVPVTAASYAATGNTVNFMLNFAPANGAELMVVKNSGHAFINGTFSNLSQGQVITLTYAGRSMTSWRTTTAEPVTTRPGMEG